MVNQSDSNRPPDQVWIPERRVESQSSLNPDLHRSLALPLLSRLSVTPSLCVWASCSTSDAFLVAHLLLWLPSVDTVMIFWLSVCKWEWNGCLKKLPCVEPSIVNWKWGGFNASPDKCLKKETFWRRECMKLHSRILIDPIQGIN